MCMHFQHESDDAHTTDPMRSDNAYITEHIRSDDADYTVQAT